MYSHFYFLTIQLKETRIYFEAWSAPVETELHSNIDSGGVLLNSLNLKLLWNDLPIGSVISDENGTFNGSYYIDEM